MALLYLLSAWFLAGVACWSTFVALGLRFEARGDAVPAVATERMAA